MEIKPANKAGTENFYSTLKKNSTHIIKVESGLENLQAGFFLCVSVCVPRYTKIIFLLKFDLEW